MAKRRKKSSKSKGSKSKGSKRGGSQRAKFRDAAHKCARQVRESGAAAFSKESWRAYGSCMKKSL
jgi:hypothetical protein